MIQRIQAYDEDQYAKFMRSLSDGERLKIQKAFVLLQNNEEIPAHYISYIEDGIYEFRITYGNNEFRIFFIYESNIVIILLNAYRKKNKKDPSV